MTTDNQKFDNEQNIIQAVEERASKMRETQKASDMKTQTLSNLPFQRIPSTTFVEKCLSRNKVGDAELFNFMFKEKYIFRIETKDWLFWNGNYWEVDPLSSKMLADTEQVCVAYEDFYNSRDSDEEDKFMKKIMRRIDQLRDLPGRTALLNICPRTYEPPIISIDDFEKQPYLLATPSGVVDLRAGECASGTQEQYLMRYCETPFTKINEPCPTFDKFLFHRKKSHQTLKKRAFSLLNLQPCSILVYR